MRGTVYRRGRTRAAAVFVVVAMVAGVLGIHVWPAGASGSPDRPIDRDIESYALFARSDLYFKGARPIVAATRGYIRGGDIGLNDVGASGNHARLCENYYTHMDDGTQANGDSMLSSDNCDFYDVYANSFTGSPPAVPRNSGPTTFTGPIIASLPSFPSFSCNPANPVTVNTTLTLPPGTYGDLELNDDAVLTLQAGTYTFCNFQAGVDTQVINTDSTIVQDAGDWVTNNGINWGPSCLSSVYVQDDKVRFARNGEIHGRFWAPNAEINLGDTSDLYGKFWGDQISSDADDNVDMTGCTPLAPSPTTTTTDAGTTTTTDAGGTTTTTASGGTTTTTASGGTTTTTAAGGTTTTTAAGGTTTTTAGGTTTTTAVATTTTTVAPTTTTTAGGTTTTTAASGTTTTTAASGTTTTTVHSSNTTTTVHSSHPTTTTTPGANATFAPSTTTTTSNTPGSQVGDKNGTSGTGSGSLPFTGSDNLGPLGGLSALAVGAFLMIAGRRRRPRDEEAAL